MVKKEAKIGASMRKEPKGEEEELKPGQKFATPTPGFADRVFYETLLRQRPDSEMAQEWCVSYGVLPTHEAIKLHEVVQKRKKKNGNTTSSTPAKPESAAAAKKYSKKLKTKSKIDDGGAVDSGMQIGGAEGIGSVVF